MKKLSFSAIFVMLALLWAPGAWCSQEIAAESSPDASALHAGAADVPGLIGVLKTGDGPARSQAQYALIRLGKDAVPGLIEALGQREDVPEIVYVLNSIKDERAAGPLAGLLDMKDEDALSKVEAALFSLGRPAVPFLFEAMKDPARRAPACAVLSSMKDPKYFKTLHGYLQEKDSGLRASAAAVERSWLDADASGIMGGLLSDENPAVRREASAYFLALSPNVSMPDHARLLKDPDETVRIIALKAAVKDREPGLAPGLVSVMTDDPSPEARRLAGDALYKCCPDKAAGPFVAALGDRDDSVAVSAAGHLGELKAKESVKPLLVFLTGRQRPPDEVVEVVARALADIGEGFDPNVFLPYINWENLYVVRSVLRAWEETARPGDVKIKEALERYVRMQVDNRYKERVKRLIEKLSQPA
jgi:HEAT repeat protein